MPAHGIGAPRMTANLTPNTVAHRPERTIQMSDAELTQQLAGIDAMFVQVAPAAESADGRLILKNVAESTLFFSDRPQRVVGHIHTAQLVSVWDDGDNSFAA